MDVEIGSNLYRNTDGAVEIEGVPQLMLALRRPGGPLLVNFVLYDNVGRVVAKVVDSTIAFNERRAYELTKLPAASAARWSDCPACRTPTPCSDPRWMGA